jgi:PAS domain S-box-containing protein
MDEQNSCLRLSMNEFVGTGASSRATQETDKKLADQYAPILNYFNDVIFLIDPSGRFVFVNKASEQRTGIPAERFIGRHFLEIIDPVYHEFAQSSFQRAMKGEKVPPIEMERETERGENVTLEVSWTTIRDDGVPPALLAVSRDVSDRKRAQEALRRAADELEVRVRERTDDLLKANELLKQQIKERKLGEQGLKKSEKQLKLKTKKLEESNTALRVLLKRRQEDQRELEDKVLSNVKELVEPYLKKVQRTKLTERQEAYLSILESNLREIVAPFTRRLFAKFMNLTHSEIQIANLVKHGMSTKEISEAMSLSKKTVEFHRDNIRKKIGIKKTKANLRSYLLSLQ